MTICKTYLILFVSLSLCSLIRAQVTIGSSLAPVSGAILQLKETDDIGANATKGLMLPRISLEYQDVLTVDEDIKKDESIGMWVYNVNTFCSVDNRVLGSGVYIWDGSLWQPLSSSTSVNSNKVWITKDQDGNTFTAARFGNQIWMTQNLAVRSFDTESEAHITGETFPTSPGRINTNLNTERSLAAWAYLGPNPLPDGTANMGTTSAFYDLYPEFGFAYSWILATANANPAASADHTLGVVSYKIMDQRSKDPDNTVILSDEVENYQVQHGVLSRPYIQGICPNGWRLPSDRDFRLLGEELFNNPEPYSYISNAEQQTWIPNVWQPEWNNFVPLYSENVFQSWQYGNDGSNGGESNLSQVFKTSCFPPLNGDNTTFQKGKSLSLYEGGFNVLPTGDLVVQGTRNYGVWSIFMSSSFTAGDPTSGSMSKVSYVGRSFYFTKEPVGNYTQAYRLLGNGNPDLSNFSSVRCVYNNSTGYKSGMPESWQDLF